jgi:FkbM family methyltransferase
MLSTAPAATFRSGTNDAHIYAECVSDNVYRLPDDLTGALIVDIGAHCGFFALACLDRGAALVYACEPEAANVQQARQHLAPYGERVVLAQLAVMRSDGESAPARMEPYHFMADAQLYNTGSPSCFAAQGPVVDSLTFDELVRLVLLESPDIIDLLKIDAQSSEWPILLTATTLDHVQRLVGEFEELGLPGGPPIPAAMGPGLPAPLTREVLRACLEAKGFAVEIVMTPTDPRGHIGLFFAERRP